MSFQDKLNTIITIFRMNNITLARGIGVDPSLVSRWRTGERTPAKIEGAAQDIASFLSGVEMLPLDLKQLEDTTGSPCKTRQDTEKAIYGWMTDDSEGRQPVKYKPPEAMELTGIFADFLARERRVSTAPLNLWPHVQGGLPTEHEVFLGNKGRRQAVINFMRGVQSATRPGHVWMSGWADPSWLEDQESFADLWLRCLQMTLQNGHHLHLLTPPIYTPDALASLLRLPIHHLGKCTMYTERESDAIIIMAGTGMGAVMSYPGGQETTLYFKAPRDSAFFENMARRLFDGGMPLLETCTGQEDVARFTAGLEEAGGDMLTARSSIDIDHIPREAVKALLENALPPEEAERRLDFLAKRGAAMDASLRTNRRVEYIPGSVLDEMAERGECSISGAQLMLDGDAALTGGTLRRTLENILRRLRLESRFFVATGAESALPLSILFRKGKGALFMADRSKREVTAAYLGDPGLLAGLEQWFDARTLTKEDAAARIESVLRRLDQNQRS